MGYKDNDAHAWSVTHSDFKENNLLALNTPSEVKVF